MMLVEWGHVFAVIFDKMGEGCISIHKDNEQQTDTISKVGINTSLNTPCLVPVKANTIYQIYDKKEEHRKTLVCQI